MNVQLICIVLGGCCWLVIVGCVLQALRMCKPCMAILADAFCSACGCQIAGARSLLWRYWRQSQLPASITHALAIVLCGGTGNIPASLLSLQPAHQTALPQVIVGCCVGGTGSLDVGLL